MNFLRSLSILTLLFTLNAHSAVSSGVVCDRPDFDSYGLTAIAAEQQMCDIFNSRNRKGLEPWLPGGSGNGCSCHAPVAGQHNYAFGKLVRNQAICVNGHGLAFAPDENGDCATPKERGCSSNNLGHPCNVSNGNKYRSEVDIDDGALHFVRSYNSQAQHDVGLGVGWRSNHQRALLITLPFLQQISASGRAEPWTKLNGLWVGDPDSNVSITEDSSGFTVVRAQGMVENYNLEGQLITQLAPNGERNNYTYNTNGQLIAVNNSYGQALSFQYHNDHMVAMEDELGAQTRYEYDTHDNLVTVVYPDQTPLDNNDNPRKHYHYENNDYPSHLTGITDSNGERYATFHYNSKGEAVDTSLAQTSNGVPQQRYQILTMGTPAEIGTFGSDGGYSSPEALCLVTYDYWNSQAGSNFCGASEIVGGCPTWQETDIVKQVRAYYDNTSQGCSGNYHQYNQDWTVFCPPGTVHDKYGFCTVANGQGFASQKIVSDGAGTQTQWIFTEILGVRKLVGKTYLEDSKGFSQTWDANGNKLTVTDAEGRTTAYTYNASNQRTSVTEASGTPQVRTTTYEYVSADIDLVAKITSPSIRAGQNKEVVNTYDANLNIAVATINGFDAQGNAVSRSTSFQYDALGKVTQIDGPRTDVADITTFEYYHCTTGGECGQLKKVTDALGHSTRYDAYDANARLLQSTAPNGVVTTYSYHPRGWLLGMTQTPLQGSARVTSYRYDNEGQLTQVTQPDGSQQYYVYDAAHDLREVTDNLGNKLSYTYDSRGNRTHELVYDPDDTLVRSTITAYDIRNFVESINAGGSVTQLVNDAVGNLSSQTDPKQNPATVHGHDALDRLTSTIDALTNNSAYQYNVADQLTQVTAPNGAATEYQYDDLANQTKEISADRGTITYTHDAAGNIASMIDARGVQTNYQYDALNRLIAHSLPTSSENVSYTYDAGCAYSLGRLCRVDDDSGDSTYDYDAWGNVVRHEKTERDDANAVLGSFVTHYQYDNANRLLKMTYPSGRTLTIGRDAIGRLVSLSTTDANGTNTNIITSRSYRADGYWTEQTYGNGLVQTKAHDTQGRLTDHAAGSYARQYQFDANGNILSADAPDNSVDRNFGYDALDRLTQEDQPILSLASSYGYDANGNRQQLTENGQANALTYSPNTNRLNNIDGTALVLDASGRTVTDQAGRSYTYNDAGRIRSIEQNSAIVGEYTYDYQQLRTQKLIAQGIRTIYLYDLAGNMIAEADSAGNVIQEHVYADGERVATIDPQFGVHYYVNDHLSTPQRLLNAVNEMTWEASYDAFGAVDISVELVVNNHRFPGQYFDSESGLHYNWNRYYDPTTGRYVTSDPIGLDGGMNTYRYANANSLKYYDPDGRFAFLAALPFIGGAAGGTTAAGGGTAVAYGAAALGGLGIGYFFFGDDNVVPLPGTSDLPQSCEADDGDSCDSIFTELTARKAELLGDLALIGLAKGKMTPTISAFLDDTIKDIRELNELIEEYNKVCPKKITPIGLGLSGIDG